VKVEFKPVTPASITYIVANLRNADLDELKATLPECEPMQVAWFVLNQPGHAYVCWLDDNPVFAFGVMIDISAPHRGVVWGFGTDDTPKVMLALTKFVRRRFIRELLEVGLDRAEVRVSASHLSSLSWISKALKAKYETDLQEFGSHGETFVQYAWTRNWIFLNELPHKIHQEGFHGRPVQ
jgi:hypothetical protein